MAEYDLPEEVFYTKEDEWVRADEERWVIGITDYAQQQLGDVVFVELPEVGGELQVGESFGVIESVKAVSDLFAPVSGKVIETNPDLEETPELVNESPYDSGWFLAVEPGDPNQVEGLMHAVAYRDYIAERED